jgi:hypothetical protein
LKSSKICRVEECQAVQEDLRRRLIITNIMSSWESIKKLKNQKYEKRIGRRL